jgi:hypothetical protein
VFALTDDLARACVARARVALPADVGGAGALLEGLARTMPTGSTTKLAAIARDQVPPGADPNAVVEAWLERPGWAWSCWAISTLFAALVEGGGCLRAEVIGARRIDPSAPPVDIHSVVVLHDGERRWLTDPYFGIGPIAEPGGDRIRPGSWGEAFSDGTTWWTACGSAAGRSVARYRTFTHALTPGDVEALCRVSVTHSGVAPRPRAYLATPDGSMSATEDRDGRVVLRRWHLPAGQVWGADPQTEALDSWSDAEARIAEQALAGARTPAAGAR